MCAFDNAATNEYIQNIPVSMVRGLVQPTNISWASHLRNCYKMNQRGCFKTIQVMVSIQKIVLKLAGTPISKFGVDFGIKE